MRAKRPTNHIAAENLALFNGRTIGFRATVVVHCLDGRGEQGSVTVQTFYPHASAGSEWLLAAHRIIGSELRRRGLIEEPAPVEVTLVQERRLK